MHLAGDDVGVVGVLVVDAVGLDERDRGQRARLRGGQEVGLVAQVGPLRPALAVAVEVDERLVVYWNRVVGSVPASFSVAPDVIAFHPSLYQPQSSPCSDRRSPMVGKVWGGTSCSAGVAGG